MAAVMEPSWPGKSTLARVRAPRHPQPQRAQAALALTLAKRPRVLLLDEPVAALDPLARRHFLGTLADAVAAGGLTAVLSSHLVADIERVCDHLILLASSRVQLCGDIEGLLNEHRVLVGPRKDTTAIERDHTVVQAERTARQTTMLVRLNGPVADRSGKPKTSAWRNLCSPQHRPHRSLNSAAPLKPLPEPVDLEQYRVRRRTRVGGMINEYRLVA